MRKTNWRPLTPNGADRAEARACERICSNARPILPRPPKNRTGATNSRRFCLMLGKDGPHRLGKLGLNGEALS
ncbi:hypothetical protein GGQ79_002131 [Ochrobactrum pecoris]|uniref:Uncharacterized protein n=1 Tax=Brucella pecoris TaxID=867683 RepID=A0AB34YTG9_9HYPH|nr:hypothetical protein [Brucella pecoris]